MKKYVFFLGALLVLNITPLLAEEEGVLDAPYSMSVVTPHVKWANPYYKGKLKIFMVFGYVENRKVIEVAQRLSCDFETVTLYQGDPRFALGGEVLYDKVSQQSILDGVTAKLKNGGYDVVILGGGPYKDYFSEIEKNLIKQITEKGTGLIQFNMDRLTPKTSEICPFGRVFGTAGGEKKWELLDPSNYIVSGIPVNQMSSNIRAYLGANEKVNGKMLIKAGFDPKDNTPYPLLVTGEAGKGRVVGLSGLDDSEAGWQMLIKAILWAAKKEPELMVTDVSTDKKNYDYKETGKGAVTISFEPSGKEKELNADFYIDTKFILNQKISGKKTVFNLPSKLASGTYDANIVIKDGGKAVNSGSARFNVKSIFPGASITLDKNKDGNIGETIYAYGSKITGKAKATTTPDYKISTELWDNYERCLVRVDGAGSFEFDTKEFLRLRGFIKVRALDAEGNVADEVTEKIIVGLSDSARKWDDWEVMTSIINNAPPLKAKVLMKPDPWAWGGFSSYAADINAKPSPIGMVVNGVNEVSAGAWNKIINDYARTKSKKQLIRLPCINSPGYIEIVDTICTRIAKSYKTLGLLGNVYINGDEQSYTSYTAPFDYCYCDYCIKEFRAWIKTQYKTFSDLNQEWGSSFKSWDEVEPPLTSEAKGKEAKIAGWNDHRIFNNITWAKGFKIMKDKLRETHKEAEIGICGTQAPSAFGGYDWERLMEIFGGQTSYWGTAGPIKRSFNRAMKDAPFTGWGESYNTEQVLIWRYMFNDCCGVSYYAGANAIWPDFNPTPSYVAFTKNSLLIRERGLAKCLMNAERPHDGVAIYYSQPSINAAFMTNEKYNEDWGELLDLLANCGWQNNFISPKMLKDGELQKKGYKILFLPSISAISKEEADIMKTFVNNGGVLYADGNAGKRDEHAKLYKDGSILKELFTQDSTADISSKKTGKGYGIYQNDYFYKVNRKAYYLNKDYLAFYKKFKAELEEKAGLKPAFTAAEEKNGSPLFRTEIFKYQSGPIKYIGLVAEENSNVDKIRKFKLQLDGKYHVYNSKLGKYIGEVSEFSDSLEVADGVMYTLLPYQVGSVKITSAPAKVKPGDTVTVNFSVNVAKGEKTGDHIVHVNIFGPSGERLDYLSKNVLTKVGVASCSFFIPLNGAGTYKAECTDAQSGVTGNLEIKAE